MNVTCPNCATIYRVDPAKVPDAGVRARCAVCTAIFPVRREGAGVMPTSAATAPEMAPPAPTPAPAPPPRTPEPAPPPPPPPAPVVQEQPPAPAPPPPAPSPPPTPAPSAPAPFAPMAPPAAAPPALAPPAAAAPRHTPPPAMRPPIATPRPAGIPAAPRPAAPPPPSAAAPPPPSRAPAAPAPAPSAGAGAAAPRKTVNPFLSQDPSQKARRLARALISDMVVYHPAKRREGLRDGNLKELFEEEIKKSWEEYSDQVGREVADSTTHFKDALNEILADGRQIF